MIILDGKKVSLERMEVLRQKVANLGFTPKLAIVRVGDRADSLSYIKRKVEYGEKLGVATEVIEFTADISQEHLVENVEKLSGDAGTHGIIVQLPLPDHIDATAVIAAIAPAKDVDGLGAANIRALVAGEQGMVAATAKGIGTLLAAYNISLAGKHVVVVGRSLLVGKSAALHLLNSDATVTVCHSKTVDLAVHTKAADILVVAIGKPGFITAEYVREGQVIVDVGISPLDEEITGDVDFENVKNIVAAISPVPGGVGPMTVISLFENLIDGL